MNGVNYELDQKPLKGLWLVNKPMLDQAHPQKNCSPWRIHAGMSEMCGCCFKGNSITCSKRVQIVMDIQLILAFIYVVTDGLRCML